MFCTNCGNPVDEGTAFCTKCGAKTNATVEASDTDSAPECPASGSKRSFGSKMKALLIAGSTKATNEDVESILDAQYPDRHLPFKARIKTIKARIKTKWNRVLAKQFGIGPDAGPEGPAPTYDWWRNTLAVLTTFFLVIAGLVILVVTLSRD